MAQATTMLIALLTTKRVSKAGSSPACEAVKWRHQQHSLAMETSAKSSLGLPSRKQQLGNSLQTSSTCPAWSRTADPASCSDGAKSASSVPRVPVVGRLRCHAVFPDGGHSATVSSSPFKRGAFFAGAMHSRDEDAGKVTSLVAPG